MMIAKDDHYGKILIIRLSSFGDILLASPLIRWTRRRFPDSNIDFAVRERFSDLVVTNPHLNQVRTLKEPADFSCLKELASEIFAQHYDLIIDIHSNFRSWYLCSLSKAKIYRWNLPRFRRWLLIKFKKNFLHGYPPVPLRYLSAVDELGVKDDGEGLEFQIKDKILDEVDKLWKEKNLSGKKIAVISPGAKWFTKRWIPEKFASLGKALLKKYCDILIFVGSSDEYELCHEICKEIGGDTINLAGKTDFHAAGEIIRRCNIFIGNDSGLGHFASAVGTPAVILFGPTVKEFGFFPFRSKSTVIEKDIYCRPCSHIGSDKCPERHFKCMNEIEIDDVLRAAESLF